MNNDQTTSVAASADTGGTPAGIDLRLREASRDFDRSWTVLEELIAEAKTRQIHTALGYPSWTDYIADVARTEMPNVARSVEQRRELVGLLSGEGMSTRAIADAVGVSNATVSRDQQVLHDVTPESAGQVLHDDSPADDAATQVSHDDSPEPVTVTGRDGKTYPKHPKRKREPIGVPPWEPKPPEYERGVPLEFSDGQIADRPWLAPREEWGGPARGGAGASEPGTTTPLSARLKVRFGDEWTSRRFTSDNHGEPIVDYVHSVASIGQIPPGINYPSLEHYDLETPIGNTLPSLLWGFDDEGATYTERLPFEREAATRLAAALRAALPRINELIDLLDRRAH